MTEIVTPFAQFFDTNGAPLNNGAIFIGTAYLDAQTNPIPVYWDDALTIPAAQPIRTLNGYAVRNGTPARLFCEAANFSMTVQTRTGRTVWAVQDATSVPTTSDPQGSSLIGFLQSGAGAVARTAQSKMRDVINVADYLPAGTVTATTDCQPFIRAAINEAVARGGGIIYIPPGEYRLTTMELGAHFNITDKSDIAFIGYGVLLKTTFSTPTPSTNAMFLLDGCRRFSFEGIRIQGNFARVLSVVSDYSIGAFVIQSSNRDGDGLILRNVEASFVHYYFISRAVVVPTVYRARNILIENGLYEDGYYGINCQNNGDNLTARNFRTVRPLRSYFVYGVANHDVSYSSYGQDAFTDCVIAATRINTQNISVNAFIFGATTINAHLAIESLHDPVEQPVPATIKDVRVNINDINSTVPTLNGSIRFGYFQNGVVVATSAAPLFDNIVLSGVVASYIDFTVTQPTASGNLNVADLKYNAVGTAYPGSRGFYQQMASNVRADDSAALEVRGGGNTQIYGTSIFYDSGAIQMGYIDGTVGVDAWSFVTFQNRPFEITYGLSPYAAGTLTAQIVPLTAVSFGVKFYEGANTTAPNAANSVMRIGQMNVTGRSISAAGTINASGADYAEYERNNGLSIARGSIVGFKADGTLTLTYSEAVRFGVKSTNPALVGGDDWACAESMSEDEYSAARAEVDRVAYSGKVPANVTGAAPGDYIIAAEGEGGAIVGMVVSTPTFKEYRRAVGRVNRTLEDGRAEIAVIVH